MILENIYNMENNLRFIANNFLLEGEVKEIKPLGEGFINDTYIVETESSSTPNYLMQRKNKNIFNYSFQTIGNETSLRLLRKLKGLL